MKHEAVMDSDSISVDSDLSDDDDVGPSTHRSTSSRVTADETLHKKENIAVSRSKLLVLVVLVLAAAAVGTFWYIFLSAEEERDFETQAVEASRKILDSADASAKHSLRPLRSLSNALTAHVLSTSAEWPYVTLPNFDIQSADSFEERGGAELIIFAPLVPRAERRAWEKYSVENQGWLEDDMKNRGLDFFEQENIPDEIFDFVDRDDWGDFYVPLWQVGPVPMDVSAINMDLYSHPSFRRMIDDAFEVEHILLSEVIEQDEDVLSSRNSTLDHSQDENPRSYAVQPVFDTFGPDASVVGFIFAVVTWDSYFKDVLPKGTDGFRVDVSTNCGPDFTYKVDGPDATYIGRELNLGDPQYSHLQQRTEFVEFARWDGEEREGIYTIHCEYGLSVTPTDEFSSGFLSLQPLLFSIAIVLVFVFTTLVFIIYDCTVQRRQQKVVATATKSNKIIASLFPRNIQKRLMEEAEEKAEETRNLFGFNTKARLGDYLDGGENEGNNRVSIFESKPLADLFPECTIMFADIVGFTAWSSTREPSQVFTLLETIYHNFDDIAKRRRIFKVETVGDCYVAVSGVPTPRADHAVAMARFASECLHRLRHVLRDLEVSLGPSTTELGLRVGLHSGPVTAGVLRGDRARFQLFGDTMNTCSRIETAGKNGRIHISEQTANLLEQFGKGHWLRQREELVTAKGKGELKTFWVRLHSGDSAESKAGSTSSVVHNDDSNVEVTLDGRLISAKQERLVQWSSEMLSKHLKEIIARRQARFKNGLRPTPVDRIRALEEISRTSLDGETVINEVEEIIYLPQFDAVAAKSQADPQTIELSQAVSDQLRHYVMALASLYRDNPFHNFEHANHVASSVSKLLSRIVAPDLEVDDENNAASTLHDYTFGITSDPLTQFAVILSAVIHDADHQGVPNLTLVSESATVAEKYKNKSVAEQNSVDLCWDLLMNDEFEDLRHAIYSTESEFKEFRQLIVNTVLATDIMDVSLSKARKARWNLAFSEQELDESEERKVNRKATIVIEHLIQASDVAHTMQHWHVFRKWNQRLFNEMYTAYREGRADKDPSVGWYESEIGFFDFYIIPLAKKLNDCGVFGVSSDEYLNYALNNRKEWEIKGKEIVAEMVEQFNSK